MCIGHFEGTCCLHVQGKRVNLKVYAAGTKLQGFTSQKTVS
jgi:hypothetical protein